MRKALSEAFFSFTEMNFPFDSKLLSMTETHIPLKKKQKLKMFVMRVMITSFRDNYDGES